MSRFEVEVWGARGSVAAFHPDVARAGSNTTCVCLRLDGHVVILDAGTGIVRLGEKLRDEGVRSITVILSHYHFDHVQGLNFFAPLADRNAEVTFIGGALAGARDVEDAVRGLFQRPYCPNGFAVFDAKIGFQAFARGTAMALPGGAQLRAVELCHPGGAFGLRIEHAGASFVFAPDFELDDTDCADVLQGLLTKADLAFLDAMFTVDELAVRRGYGHSNPERVAGLCAAAQVKRWCMFHHAPLRSDAELDRIEARLAMAFPGTTAAREGDRFTLA